MVIYIPHTPTPTTIHTHWCTQTLTHLEYGGFGSVSGKIETDIKINHEGEVNRYMYTMYTKKTLPYYKG